MPRDNAASYIAQGPYRGPNPHPLPKVVFVCGEPDGREFDVPMIGGHLCWMNQDGTTAYYYGQGYLDRRGRQVYALRDSIADCVWHEQTV
jgi:hypothetical protein